VLKIVSIVISGVDRFTGTAGKTLKSLDMIQTRMEKFGRGFAIGGAGALAGGYGLARVTGLDQLPGQLVRAERSLISLGNVGDLTKEQLKPLGDEVFRLQKITNQTNEELLTGLNTLVAAGLDPIQAKNFLKPIGQAATAENAEIQDLARTTFTVYDNLKVPVNDLNKALNIMTLAGKRGRFELKDMAREFPALSAGASLLGLSNQKTANGLTGGLRAVSQMSAALQISMKGAGTPEQAANNMANFYQKVFSNETMQQMKKITGSPVTLIKLWSKAMKDGQDPVEQTIKYLDDLTNAGNKVAVTAEEAREAGGYKAARIGKIFTDRQVQDFVKIMMPNLERYAELRDEWVKRPLKDQDIISKDFANIMGSTAEQWKLLKINMAATLAPNLGGPLATANNLIKEINQNSLLTKGILISIGGLLAGGLILTSLGAMAFSFSSIAAFMGSTLTGATLFAKAAPAMLIGLKAVAVAGAGMFAVMITDGLTKAFLGYKVGLGDIVSSGGYYNALEDKRKEDLRIKLKSMYPHWTDERIEAQVNKSDGRPGSAPAQDPGTFQYGWGGMGMGAYYMPAPKAKVEVEFKNAPPGTKVTTVEKKGMDLNADRGPYRN